MEVINALGRRKAAVARVYVKEGAGQITINGRDLNVYFPSSILQYVVKQPLEKLGVAEKYDIKANLDGGGFKGQASDIKINADHILAIKDKLNRILADATGQELSVIEKDTDRDNYMTAAEAAAYGLVDKVIERSTNAE